MIAGFWLDSTAANTFPRGSTIVWCTVSQSETIWYKEYRLLPPQDTLKCIVSSLRQDISKIWSFKLNSFVHFSKPPGYWIWRLWRSSQLELEIGTVECPLAGLRQCRPYWNEGYWFNWLIEVLYASGEWNKLINGSNLRWFMSYRFKKHQVLEVLYKPYIVVTIAVDRLTGKDVSTSQVSWKQAK